MGKKVKTQRKMAPYRKQFYHEFVKKFLLDYYKRLHQETT